MPYTWSNNKIAVEIEELVPRFWNCYDSLKSEVLRYKSKPYGIKRLQLGGNGRKALIDFDTLPKEIQDALGDPRKVGNPLELFFELDAEAKAYYGKQKRANGNYLTPEEQEKYYINASVFKAIIKLEKERINLRIKLRGKTHGITETLRIDTENFQDYLKVNHNTEHTIPVSKRFKDALKAFKINGYDSLIKDAKGTGKQNARKVDDRVEMIINSLFNNQKHKPTPTEISRSYDAFLSGYAQVYNEDTGELYNPSEFKKLSPATIINYINKWENKIATHKSRSGNRQQYMGAFKPYHQMELPVLAGSLLSIDDRQPPFWYEKGKRAWFYIGLDVASHCITAVVYGKSKEGIILDFYRQIVRNYTEWGFKLPYELECESSLNSSFKDTLLQPGVMFNNVRIEANNARGKYIERSFGSLRYEVEKNSFGWIGRPNAKSEANQSGPGATEIIPYKELVNQRMLDLEQWNNMPHPTNKEVSRWDYFTQNQNPNLQPTNWNALLPILGYKTTTSCKLGYITLQKQHRAIAEDGKILTGEALIQKMKLIEGKEVDVYWLDDNQGNVLKALAYLNGRLICEVMQMPKYNRATNEQTPQCKLNYALQSAYVSSVEAFTKRQTQKLENIQIIDNTPKTVNSNFKFSNLKRFEAQEDPVEVFEDDQQDELVYMPAQNMVKGWRSNFNL